MMPDGQYTSFDNRRLLAARKAGMYVRARIHDHSERLPEKFNRVKLNGFKPDTWGDAIQFRVANQNSSSFQSTRNGSFNEPLIIQSNNDVKFKVKNYDIIEEIFGPIHDIDFWLDMLRRQQKS